MDLTRRIEGVRGRLAETETDFALVTKPSNVVYLTGLVRVLDEHADAACLVGRDRCLLLTNFIYSTAARRALAGSGWEVVECADGIYKEAVSVLRSAGCGLVAVESSIPYGRFRFLSESLDGRVSVHEHWVEALRTVKEPEEIEHIREAARLADRAFEYILGRIEAGRSEMDVALDLEWFMRKEGSEGMPFAPIVASGPNSADPHAKASSRMLAEGDLVKMDFGARVDGYCSDMTRTVALGEPDERLAEVHALVLEANRLGKEALKAGVSASTVDSAARRFLAEAGYEKEFGHGLGHGVGLDVHEAPRLGKNSEDSVPAGAVVTVEPGVYLEGIGGVRIEDLVVVEDGGCEVLSGSSRELLRC